MINKNMVVLFVDILGFARLTELYPLNCDRLIAPDRFYALNIDSILAEPRDELAHTFTRFHFSLESVLNIAKMHHPWTAITFSDSAFIATEYFCEAVNIATELLQTLLPQKIPIRMGIAYGSFAALRFKSDIVTDGGDHSVQFLGTAVVRAHAAEACGIKGLRILLHPSAMPLLNDNNHNPKISGITLPPIHSLECSELEQTNRAGVTHEIDYWHLSSTKEAKAWRVLQEMWDESPQSEVNHYMSTAEAINRMRINQGHEPIWKLRCRTIPRGVRK